MPFYYFIRSIADVEGVQVLVRGKSASCCRRLCCPMQSTTCRLTNNVRRRGRASCPRKEREGLFVRCKMQRRDLSVVLPFETERENSIRLVWGRRRERRGGKVDHLSVLAGDYAREELLTRENERETKCALRHCGNEPREFIPPLR